MLTLFLSRKILMKIWHRGECSFLKKQKTADASSVIFNCVNFHRTRCHFPSKNLSISDFLIFTEGSAPGLSTVEISDFFSFPFLSVCKHFDMHPVFDKSGDPALYLVSCPCCLRENTEVPKSHFIKPF